MILFPDDFVDSDATVISLNLAGNPGLRCPVHLQGLLVLVSLNMAGSGMDGCDFTNGTEVQLNRAMFQKLLDVSDCNWKPMILPVYDFPAVSVLRANRASVVGIPYASGWAPPQIRLLSLSLDNNAIANVDPKSNLQFNQFAMLFSAAGSLASLSCVNCSLMFFLPDFTQYVLFAARALQVIKLAQNQIHGPFLAATFSNPPDAGDEGVLSLSIRQVHTHERSHTRTHQEVAKWTFPF